MAETILNFIEKETKPIREINKTIYLYTALKKYCPKTIKKIKNKINGKNIFIKETEGNNWYLVILNYLTKKGIIEYDKRDNGVYHQATYDYTKYFEKTQSSLYNIKTLKTHFELKKNTIQDFFEKAGLLDKNYKEFVLDNKKEKTKLDAKTKKTLKILSIFLISWSLIQFIMQTTKFGYYNMLPIFLNTILFTLGFIINQRSDE